MYLFYIITIIVFVLALLVVGFVMDGEESEEEQNDDK